MRAAASDTRVVNLAGGLPSDAQFPRQALAAAFVRVVSHDGGRALQYGWAEGAERLRGFVAKRLRARGAAVDADDVIVTAGAQQGIAIALELTTRTGRRDRVGVGDESYPAALDLMRARGLAPVAPLTGVRVRYVMPAIDNPRGRAMADAVRRTLIATRPAIIEDDAYADLAFDGPAPRPLLADAPDRVLHVGTLSKTLCPGLRIGWLVVPRPLRSRALRLKQSADLQASSLGQAVAETYLLGEGRTPPVDFDARLVRLRRFYRRRAAMLGRALRAALPGWRFTPPAGGFAFWVEAPADAPRVDELAWLRAALEAGVMFDPGSSFRPDGAAGSAAARLCFSSAPVEAFAVGVRRFARAWRRCVTRGDA